MQYDLHGVNNYHTVQGRAGIGIQIPVLKSNHGSAQASYEARNSDYLKGCEGLATVPVLLMLSIVWPSFPYSEPMQFSVADYFQMEPHLV